MLEHRTVHLPSALRHSRIGPAGRPHRVTAAAAGNARARCAIRPRTQLHPLRQGRDARGRHPRSPKATHRTRRTAATTAARPTGRGEDRRRGRRLRPPRGLAPAPPPSPQREGGRPQVGAGQAGGGHSRPPGRPCAMRGRSARDSAERGSPCSRQAITNHHLCGPHVPERARMARSRESAPGDDRPDAGARCGVDGPERDPGMSCSLCEAGGAQGQAGGAACQAACTSARATRSSSRQSGSSCP